MKFIAIAMAAAAVSADVTIFTKAWGSECRFTITNAKGEKVCEHTQSGYPNNSVNPEECQFPVGPGNVLTCSDTYGDGWHGGYILINGEKYCEDFKSGRTKTVPIKFETFNYDSTGGHAAVQSVPLAGVTTAGIVRGGGDLYGEHTNTLNNKVKDIAK